ncbi:hypothetical protein Misp02_63970 [Microtetraspora sp. NBRC 16547]|nr:hypothetical protein Misp02_63970 [Microtetraspora sp. NBRC 16547]
MTTILQRILCEAGLIRQYYVGTSRMNALRRDEIDELVMGVRPRVVPHDLWVAQELRHVIEIVNRHLPEDQSLGGGWWAASMLHQVPFIGGLSVCIRHPTAPVLAERADPRDMGSNS